MSEVCCLLVLTRVVSTSTAVRAGCFCAHRERRWTPLRCSAMLMLSTPLRLLIAPGVHETLMHECLAGWLRLSVLLAVHCFCAHRWRRWTPLRCPAMLLLSTPLRLSIVPGVYETLMHECFAGWLRLSVLLAERARGLAAAARLSH
jgi:hypothetical protein